jgi:carbonic anhydrase
MRHPVVKVSDWPHEILRIKERTMPLITPPDRALAILKRGNEAYLRGESVRPEQIAPERRLEQAAAQQPFCVLVGCSDSRVPPELLFGRGLGELFIVRNAGNVVDLAAMGSIEYGVTVLGVPLIVVLGHERCGAVAAAIDVVQQDTNFPGSIGQMIEPIIPAVLRAQRTEGDDLLAASVKANVARIVERLKSTEQLLLDRVNAGSLKIVGAYYNLSTGAVDFFE